ncbi:MAG: hypothetical protein ACM3ZT_08710 [Bacillota bacterium]
MRIASVGHGVFAAAFIGLGITGFIKSEYAALWQGVPKGFPARDALPYLCALVSLGCGLGLLWPRSASLAARVLLGFLLAWTLAFKVRFIILAPLQEGAYQSTGENAVVIAGGWVLFTWLATDWDRKQVPPATGAMGLRIARICYAFAMIAFGFSHFAYLQLTAPLIPSWLLWPVFWAYFTGTAYLAAGAAVLSGVWARLAATLSTVQMGAFLLLVWLPIMLAGKMTDFNWGEVVVNLMLVAGGWVVAESYRGQAWLAVGKR